MRWLLAILIVAVCVVGVVYIAGSRQPEEHLATRSALIAASPDAVWKRISDVPGEPSWRKSVKSVTPLPPRTASPASPKNVGIALHVCVERTDGERLRIVSRGRRQAELPGHLDLRGAARRSVTDQWHNDPAHHLRRCHHRSPLWRGAMLFMGYDSTVKAT